MKPTPAQLTALREAEQAELDVVRSLALKSTWVMATEVLWPKTWRDHYFENLHLPLTTMIDKADRGARRLVIIPRSHRKCVTGDTLITMADGSHKPAKQLSIGDDVLAFTEDWKLAPAKIHALGDNGTQKCVRVKFRSGREVVVTTNHPFKTFFGWTDAEWLEPGDKVPVGAKQFLTPSDLTIEESALLGYLTGDGCVANPSNIGFSNIDQGVLDRVRELCGHFGYKFHRRPSANYCDWSLVGGATEFVRKFGIGGKKSIDKSIPLEVMRASDEVAKAFIGAWYDCDGGINSVKRTAEVRFYTSSRVLAHDGLYLLSRLGYSPKLSYRPKLRGYTIHLADGPDVRRFFDEVPIYSSKKPLESHFSNTPSRTYLRCLPKGWHKKINGPYLWHRVGIKINWKYETSFDKARRLAATHQEILPYLDFQWDQVVSVEDAGSLPTISIQVEPHNTLLLEGLVTHNTMLLTVARSVRLICADPNVRVLIVTALDDTAKLLSQLIKRQFQENDGLRKYFPDLCVPTDRQFGTQYGFEHPMRNNTALLDPTLRATYLGAPLIGRRADVLILDDPIDEDKVATPDLTKKTNSQINELLPLLDPASKYNVMDVIGTPKSSGDYYALASGTSGTTTEEGSTKPTAVFVTVRRAALENAKGEPDINGDPILPNVHTRASLMAMLEQARLDPKLGESYWWREMMTTVQAPGDVKFLPEWFDKWVPKLPPDIVRSFIAIDKADKDEQILYKGDFTVLLCGHFDTYGRLFLTDGVRANNWRTTERKQHLLAMCQRNGGVSDIVQEKVGDGGEMGQIRGWFNDARLPVTLHGVNVRKQGKKLVRVVDFLQGPLQASKIYFVGEPDKGLGFPKAVWQTIKDELTHLGMWSHDDAADALSLFFHPDVRVVAPNRAQATWRPPISRAPQISTGMTNPSALAAYAARHAAPNQDKRLTPTGLESNIDLGVTTVQNRPNFVITPQKIETTPDGKIEPWWLRP